MNKLCLLQLGSFESLSMFVVFEKLRLSKLFFTKVKLYKLLGKGFVYANADKSSTLWTFVGSACTTAGGMSIKTVSDSL